MRFVQLREFYDYIHANFDMPRGEVSLLKIEETGAEDTIYLFGHGKRYHREGTGPEPGEKELTGLFVLYSYGYHPPSDQEMVKMIEDWYGQKIIKVISSYQSKADAGKDILVQVPYPKDGFWWNK